MWRDIWDRVKGAVFKLLRIGELESALQIKTVISSDMQQAIELWALMLQNRAPWRSKTVKSLNLPAAIAGELARLVLVEHKTEINGSSPRADYLRQEYAEFVKKLRPNLEFGLACGGVVFKPYVDGGRIVVDSVPAWRFYPTATNSRGEVTGAVFAEQVQKGKDWYTRLEQHELTDAGYIVTNKAYRSQSSTILGQQVDLTAVDEWASLTASAEIRYKDGSVPDKPLFAVFTVPFGNTIDPSSALGVSVYSRAVGLIAQADKQYSRILWEYEGSELAVDVSNEALLHKDGKTYNPQLRERLFRGLDIVDGDKDLYKVFSPAIRDTSLFNGLDKLFKRIEFNCCLAYGTLSDPANTDKTAEEIRASKQRSYSAVTELQTALQGALEHLIWCMDFYASLYKLAPAGDYETGFCWGDGICEDTEREFARRKQLADSGYLKPEKLISWYFGVSEEEAVNYIPQDDSDGLFAAEGE